MASRIALAATSLSVALGWANAALASQGPGVGPGSASPVTQLAMAIIVYGISALVVGAGLIGAVRGASRGETSRAASSSSCAA